MRKILYLALLMLIGLQANATYKVSFWLWINPDKNMTEKQMKELYRQYHEVGVKGILFEADNEQHFRIAKSAGIETHRWIWTLNRGEAYVRENHPEWFAINRKGESCYDKPPYVGYYRWLCPSRNDVIDYLKKEVEDALSKRYVDGIHLDYIRYCDIILPVNLWKNYKIVQKEELPEYDFCYCDVCKKKFMEIYHQNIDSIEYPEESLSWRQFRYDAITHVVKEMSEIAHKHHKSISAAVFPTPEIARRNVRQDWVNWDLSAVFPMVYHQFYREPPTWIGTAVHEGVTALHKKFPLYAGLYLPDFHNMDELRIGIKSALDNGANGVSLYGKIDDSVLQVMKEFQNRK